MTAVEQAAARVLEAHRAVCAGDGVDADVELAEVRLATGCPVTVWAAWRALLRAERLPAPSVRDVPVVDVVDVARDLADDDRHHDLVEAVLAALVGLWPAAGANLARHTSDPDILDELAELADGSTQLGVEVAENTATRADALDRLAGHPHYRVRTMVARNYATPVGTLRQLTRDEDSGVAAWAGLSLERR